MQTFAKPAATNVLSIPTAAIARNVQQLARLVQKNAERWQLEIVNTLNFTRFKILLFIKAFSGRGFKQAIKIYTCSMHPQVASNEIVRSLSVE